MLFGSRIPDRSRIEAILAEYMDGVAVGAINVISTSCDLDTLKIALRSSAPKYRIDVINGERMERVCTALGVNRVQIIPWNDDLRVLVADALRPASIERVVLGDVPLSAFAVVRDDQLALALGPCGRNVRLASKLCGCDIDLMTTHELEHFQNATRT